MVRVADWGVLTHTCNAFAGAFLPARDAGHRHVRSRALVTMPWSACACTFTESTPCSSHISCYTCTHATYKNQHMIFSCWHSIECVPLKPAPRHPLSHSIEPCTCAEHNGEKNPMLGVTCGVLLWADMNAATPLGAWGRSVISLELHAMGV